MYILISYGDIEYILGIGITDTLALCISILIATILVESLRKKSRWWAAGLRFDTPMIRDILFSVLLLLFIYMFIMLTFIVFGADLDINTRIFEDDIYYLRMIYVTPFAFFIAAFIEELVFRGIIFQSIMERFGPAAAAISTSAFFSILHIWNPNIDSVALINIFLAGILFAVMYIKTLSLWLPVFFHFIWNLNQPMTLGLPMSGVNYGAFFVKINYDYENPLMNLIFGGSFGIEGGLITTFILLVSTYIVVKHARTSPYMSAIKFKRNIAEHKLLYPFKSL
jgi:membrane protease YdiL (CAAX protease family)